MKRVFLLVFIQCLTLLSQAQEGRTVYQLLQQTLDRSVSAYALRESVYDAETGQWDTLDYSLKLVVLLDRGWPRGVYKDTLVIAGQEASGITLDSFNMDFTRLSDDSSTAMMVFYIVTTEWSNLGEHGNYHKKQSVMELWDLMKGTRKFSAIPQYSYEADYMEYSDPDQFLYSEIKYSYQYDIKLTPYALDIGPAVRSLEMRYNDEGNFKQLSADVPANYPYYCECQQADHRQGQYRYGQGRYSLAEMPKK